MELRYWTMLALALAAPSAGCGDDDGANGGAGPGGAGSGGQGGAGGQASMSPCEPPDPTLAEREADELFAGDEVPRFDFYLPEARWAELKAHARDEQYVEAEACYKGKSVGAVGLRFKGGYGTLELCHDAEGNLLCPKLSMKAKFDEYVDGQRFYAQKRLNFHSMVYDPSKLHERIAYGLYREMGVVAPRSAWATLHVNGESQGLFSMVEEVDGRFLNNRFPERPDGDLYKEAWPTSDDAGYYESHLETNEGEATHERVVAFAEDLTSAEGEERLAALSRWMDLAQLQRYMAVDETIMNWDGVTTFYASSEGDGYNHNFFLYDDPSSGKFHLIPWDLDNVLRVSTHLGPVPRWTETPENCPRNFPVFMGSVHVRVPGCDALFGALRQDPEGYQRALGELLAGPFSEGQIEAQVDRDAALIRAAVEEDPLGPGLAAWEQGVEQLRREVPLLRERLRRLANNTPAAPFWLTTTGVNDIETADTLGLVTGTRLYNNYASSAESSVTQEEPLSGAQSLKVSFDVRDETYAWGHYVYFTVRLAEGYLDATPLEGIRFLARADEPRWLRVDVESPAHSQGLGGIHFGWDVHLTELPQLVELRFADLAVPEWAVLQGLDPRDDLDAVRKAILGVGFRPDINGLDEAGFLHEGVTDSGHVVIDDIEFFAAAPDAP